MAAVDAGCAGVMHGGACSRHEFTVEIRRLAGFEVPIEAVETTIPPGGADRPLNGVLARRRADETGLTPMRLWQDALAGCMQAAGLLAETSAQPS